MPGFLGGSTSGGGGVGGEISFPKELIDPVTKLRVSQPETLIDTDFEYGLQPTKWETVELINNTPSFFSKSGDTTIPNIVSITTNAGTREITVTTGLDHGLAVGIPINVTGTKSITADGSYIINSIPNTVTFTYLCKDNQAETLSIEDLYTSIITGEFFQGSQLRIADSEGITTDGDPISVLTVKTESSHGFGVNTPFYFLNLNSTVAQEFEAANTAAKSFDSSNSATAQTFDGSNTLSQIQIDFSNSATIGGTPSSIVSVSTADDTITVTHTTETFVGRPLGTPLYYNVTTSAGYFAANPRGVVFLKTTNQLASGTSIFQVSEIPDGPAIDIQAAMTGTFQLANQARTFAGNNVNPVTQTNITVIKDTPIVFDGANEFQNALCTVTSYSGSLVVATSDDAEGELEFYQGAMVLYTTTGSAASGLTNNTTYFIDQFFSTGGSFNFTLKPLPTSSAITSISGGTGTQKFRKIGVSPDRDIVHIRNSNYSLGDMVRYVYPAGGAFTAASAPEQKDFYYISAKYDTHNYQLNAAPFSPIVATGGTTTDQVIGGVNYRVHSFAYTGANQTFSISNTGTQSVGIVKVWGAGGGGGTTYFATHGGPGGYGTARVDFSGLSNIIVVVGQGGTFNTTGNQSIYGHFGTDSRGLFGGFGVNSGNGGGLSGIFNNTVDQANAILIAGGGGGSGQITDNQDWGAGGPGGGPNQNGVQGFDNPRGTNAHGRGATTTAGGLAGINFYRNPQGRGPVNNSVNGGPLRGGGADNATGSWNEGGGGGSGYWGGGPGAHEDAGGYWAAAGGGSGFASSRCTNVTAFTGTYEVQSSQATSDIHYVSGVGLPGLGSNGGNGRVVIMYPLDQAI